MTPRERHLREQAIERIAAEMHRTGEPFTPAARHALRDAPEEVRHYVGRLETLESEFDSPQRMRALVRDVYKRFDELEEADGAEPWSEHGHRVVKGDA